MFRKFALGVAVAAALVAPLAGCGGSDDGTEGSAKPAASPTPTPAELLAAAVTKTTGINLKLGLAGDTADEKVTITWDGTNKFGLLSQVSGGTTTQIVTTPEDMYLSGAAELQGKTVHLVISKLPAKHDLAVFSDPVFALTILPAATGVTSPAAGSFAGTIDLAKVQATTSGAKKTLEAVMAAAGAKANAIAFTAKVDAQGYVSQFTAVFPGMDEGKDSQYDMTFAEFGAPVTVAKPTGAKVIEAPADAYAA